MQTIYRRLRRIEAINGMIRKLTEERHEAQKVILDTMPVQEGDHFSYDNEFCGMLAAAWVGYDPAKGNAHVSISYEMEDGAMKIMYDVNPGLLRKAGKRKTTKKKKP